MNITEGIIIAVVAGIGTWAGQAIALYRFRKEQPMQEKKTDAEAGASLGAGAESMSKAWQTTIDKLTERVSKLEEELSEKNDYVDILEREFKELSAKFIVMEENVLNLRKENDNLRADIKLKEARIGELELRVRSLQVELDEYRK